MDFTQAVLLIGVVYALTSWVASLGGDSLDARLKPLIAMVIGIGSVLLVAQSVWAQDQIIAGHALDSLDTFSQVVAGILIGSGAIVLKEGYQAIRNVGQNYDK